MAEAKKKIDQRRGGFYWQQNPKKPYVSVTNILNVISKPALQYWFGKKVYWAMVQEPTLEEKAALAAPYKENTDAKIRGTAVHSIVEHYKHTREYIETIPDKYQGYAKAFYNWVKDNDIEIMEHERTVWSQKYKYAGTLDMLVKNKQSGRIFIIDVKTGKDIYPESFLQLSAYEQGLKEENIEIDSLAVLLLKEDGKSKFAEGESDLEAFLAAKRLWEWRNPELMEIVNIYNKQVKEVK
ncbi:hypothetical protein LCGC14_2779260 [marine sediment metagenome]|uniref:PD-(D/E)XK endonuclease-like domain-containing protein n=1 Tax=marine sediment metagenome TaxID=412755 RepID=A0A0F8YTR3_9ZZZZ|nr:hypothetical protein [bacterium]